MAIEPVNESVPPLPMLDVPLERDAWHNVHAPGGYEWWRFDARSDDGSLLVVADFFAGCHQDAAYMRRYRRFLRRPTRHLPPLPAEHPVVSLAVYRDLKRVLNVWQKRFGADLSASANKASVRLGPHSFERSGEGNLEVVIAGEAGGAKLCFAPVEPRDQLAIFSLERRLTGADHSWILTTPRCRVQGVIEIGSARASFAGEGYRDHRYGTGPLGPGLRLLLHGRVLLSGEAVAFSIALPTDQALTPIVQLIRDGPAGMMSGGTALVEWPKADQLSALPVRIDLGEGARLSNPRLIDVNGITRRIVYDAGGSTALCDLLEF